MALLFTTTFASLGLSAPAQQCSLLFQDAQPPATPSLYARVLTLLNAPSSAHLRHEFAQWVTYIEKLQPTPWLQVRRIVRGEGNSLTELRRAKLMRLYSQLQGLRLNSSTTLSDSAGERGDAAKIRWEAADDQVMKWLEADEAPSLAHLAQLNELITQGPSEGAHSSRLASRNHYRNAPVYAGGRKNREYIDAADVPRAMQDLMNWLQEHESRLHPIELAAQAYRRFVSIHPYRDGNGRTGRLLMDWILVRKGFPPAALEPDQVEVAVFAGQTTNLSPSTGTVIARVAEAVAHMAQQLSALPE